MIPYIKIPDSELSQGAAGDYSGEFDSAFISGYPSDSLTDPRHPGHTLFIHGGNTLSAMTTCPATDPTELLYLIEESVGFVTKNGLPSRIDSTFRWTAASDGAHTFDIKQCTATSACSGQGIVASFEDFMATVAVYDNNPEIKLSNDLLYSFAVGIPKRLVNKDFSGFSTSNNEDSNPYYDSNAFGAPVNPYLSFFETNYELVDTADGYDWNNFVSKRVSDLGLALYMEDPRSKFIENDPRTSIDGGRCHSLSIPYSIQLKTAEQLYATQFGFDI